jgi:hypothetical protein
MAEFASTDALLHAARAAHADGWSAEAYAPFDVEGLDEALGVERSRVAPCTFAGALTGGVLGYAMQWFSAVVDRPLDVGARPLHSWPMFVPVTFELAVLGGALAAVAAFLHGAGLPRLRHPVFDAPDFEFATRHRFFLVLRADDPRFGLRTGSEDGAHAAAAWLDARAPLRRVAIPPWPRASESGAPESDEPESDTPVSPVSDAPVSDAPAVDTSGSGASGSDTPGSSTP